MLPARAAGVAGAGEGVLIPKGTTLADAEWLLIDAALKEAGYNRTKAAKLLGVGERTLRRKLNAADVQGAANEFLRWVYAGGRKLRGLVIRREAERKMFIGGQ